MAERKKYKDYKPEWEIVPPPEKSFRDILKWGDKKEYKEPKESLYKYLKTSLKLTDKDFEKKQKRD